MSGMLSRIPAWLRNKYMIAALAFGTWIIFFDRNDLITQAGYLSQLHTLRDQKAFLQEEIKKTEGSLYDLQSDPRKLEKFAREKYLMRKDNEDVFLVGPAESGRK